MEWNLHRPDSKVLAGREEGDLPVNDPPPADRPEEKAPIKEPPEREDGREKRKAKRE
jgi:hypothetical protein